MTYDCTLREYDSKQVSQKQKSLTKSTGTGMNEADSTWREPGTEILDTRHGVDGVLWAIKEIAKPSNMA